MRDATTHFPADTLVSFDQRRPNLTWQSCGGGCVCQRCGLRPSVLGLDRSETQKIGLGLVHCGLGLAGLMLFYETRSCDARCHNDLEGHSNFSSTIYSFSILCLEHHYCRDQQWRLLT